MRLERRLLSLLRKHSLAIASVESCTGGRIADKITDVSGSSDSFWGAWITYDNSAKAAAVGVPASLILRHGAISPNVARAMAERGLRAMRQALKGRTARVRNLPAPQGLICIATTGIAGPTGATPRKPVGLCYIAIAASRRSTKVIKVPPTIGASRERNKSLFTRRALELAITIASTMRPTA
jgi:nicotinamide-nucleotide amidase